MAREFRDAVVLSDLHLWDPDEPRYRAALRFLREVPREVDLVVVLGDLFDFWIAANELLAERFADVIAALAALRARGATVLYCEGNHDLYLEPHFGAAMGLDTFTGERLVTVAGRVVNLSHGDLVNPHDRGYLFLRWLLRTPLVRWLERVAPAEVAVAIGERASRKSRGFTARKSDPIRELSHAYARERIERGADVVVIGHTHQPERTELTAAGGRKGLYLNTGYWPPDGRATWARINATGVHLYELAPEVAPTSARHR